MEYKIKEQTEEQKKIYEELLSKEYPEIVAYSLSLRNYKKNEKLIHYSELHNIDIATDLLIEYIIKNKNICIVADYDVDGATSCSIMYKGLKKLGADIKYFVPNRFIHGYGLQPSVIDDMLNHYPDVNVIITVDNGIASIDGVDYANEKNIDVIVTDHHLEGDSKPNARVIVNPNQKSCGFPSKSLAGCGVAMYIIKALYDKISYKIKNNEFNEGQKDLFSYYIEHFNPVEIMDYLVIGTIADVVSLDDNNRLIVENGLKQIHKKKCSTGVQAILDVLGIENNKLKTTDIAFRIAPMLNAAGRLEDMSLGINLLLNDNYIDAREQALSLIEINQKRKDIEKGMKDIALGKLEDNILSMNKSENLFSFCTYSKDFHEGVIGIVASRVKDILYLPTIVFSVLDEKGENGRVVLKGSGRSIDGIHLRDAIDYVFKTVPDCIIKFGGHSMAAGLSIYEDKFEEFQKKLNEYCQKTLNNVRPLNVIEVDRDLSIDKLKITDVELLNMQTWGQNFTEPIFYGKFKILKQEILKGSHLKLFLKQNNTTINAMHFFNNKLYNKDEIEALYKININEFRGNKNIQIFIDKAE